MQVRVISKDNEDINEGGCYGRFIDVLFDVALYMDIVDKSIKLLKANDYLGDCIPASGTCDIYEVMNGYANECILPEYIDRFMACFNFDILKEAVNNGSEKQAYIYRMKDGTYKKLILFFVVF